MMVTVPVAYPQYNRYLRLQGQLRKSHAFEEKVTFRDVSFKTDKGVPYLVADHSQSLQTPSGITITLPEQNGNKPPPVRSYRGSSGFFYVHLDIDPDKAVLPGSPLYRKYKKPVRVTVEPAQGSLGARWSRSSRNYTVSFRMPQPPDSLTLRIQQQVDLQNIPLTLTVPVAGGAPPGGRVAAR